MTNNYTQKEFDSKLIELLSDIRAHQLLSISGIYEILSEEFNNLVLDCLDREKESEEQDND